MKLPITKIKKLLRANRYSFSHVEVSLWPHKETGAATPNMLLSDCDDICDIGTLGNKDVATTEDDLGLVKLDLRLCDNEWYNFCYCEVFVFDGEAYIELPSPLNTELGRAVHLARKNA